MPKTETIYHYPAFRFALQILSTRPTQIRVRELRTHDEQNKYLGESAEGRMDRCTRYVTHSEYMLVKQPWC